MYLLTSKKQIIKVFTVVNLSNQWTTANEVYALISRLFEENLTLRPASTTIVPYANSLDPDEMPSNSASHPDPSCLTLSQHFHQL